MNRYRRVAAIAVSTLAGTAATTLPARADTGNVVYVNSQPGGCVNGTPDLGSKATPFCTIQEALASSQVVSGTTLMVHGLFSGEIDITKSGITLQTWGDWAIEGGAYGISITGQHDVQVNGVETLDQAGEALRIDSSANITVNDLWATGTQHGIDTPDPALPAVEVSGSTSVALSRARIMGNPGPGLALQNSHQVTVSDTIETADAGGVAIADSTTVDVVSDTIDENCGAGVSVQGASSDVSVADDIISNARTCGTTPGTALSVDPASAAPTVDSNILTTAAGTDAVLWQGRSFAGGPALDAAGHGARDLTVDPGFASSVAPGANHRTGFDLAPTSPAIDSADSGARNTPATGWNGVARIDDPAVDDAGSGPIGYSDRGALEFTRDAAPSVSKIVSAGPTPGTYRTVTVQVQGNGTDSWWPVVNYSVDFGDGKKSGALPFADEATTTHTYSQDKTYNGNITFTDSHGRTFTSPFTVTIAKSYYSPDFYVSPMLAQPGIASASLHPGAGPLGSFTIDFGDHTPPVTRTYPSGLFTDVTETHKYAKSGTYQVTATATDTPGWSTAQPLTRTVTVEVPTTHVPATVQRIGGTDRYATARKVSQAQWKPGTASAIVLARGDAAPDALAGVPLAARVHGPLLLTDPASLDGATRAEIDRATGGPSASKTVYILGGAAAVSPRIESELRKAGYNVVRYQGTDRYSTALAVARSFGRTSHVIVATGKTFPDALAAGPLGAVEDAPIVLSGEQDRLDPATEAFVRSHPDVDPVGGAAFEAVAVLNLGFGHVVTPGLAGADRYATAEGVAARVIGLRGVAGHQSTDFGVASGETFPDALTGGAYAANAGIPLLLTAPTTLSGPTAGLLLEQGRSDRVSSVTVFGGPQAVSVFVENDIAAKVNGTVK